MTLEEGDLRLDRRGELTRRLEDTDPVGDEGLLDIGAIDRRGEPIDDRVDPDDELSFETGSTVEEAIGKGNVETAQRLEPSSRDSRCWLAFFLWRRKWSRTSLYPGSSARFAFGGIPWRYCSPSS